MVLDDAKMDYILERKFYPRERSKEPPMIGIFQFCASILTIQRPAFYLFIYLSSCTANERQEQCRNSTSIVLCRSEKSCSIYRLLVI